MGLSVQEQMLIEQRVANQAKSAGVAYLLLIFFGGFGIHRLYLGRTASGIVMLLLAVAGWATLVVGIGFAFLAVVAIWWIVDLFLVPGMVEAGKVSAREAAERHMLLDGHRPGPVMEAPVEGPLVDRPTALPTK